MSLPPGPRSSVTVALVSSVSIALGAIAHLFYSADQSLRTIAQRRKVGIGFGGGGEFLVERHGAFHPPACLGERAALARVAAEIELDRRFVRMLALRVEQDLLGRGERLCASRRISPRDPRCRLGRGTAGEFSGGGAERGPVAATT